MSPIARLQSVFRLGNLQSLAWEGDDEPQCVASGDRAQAKIPSAFAVIEDALVAVAERVPLHPRLHGRLGEVIEHIRRQFEVTALLHQPQTGPRRCQCLSGSLSAEKSEEGGKCG